MKLERDTQVVNNVRQFPYKGRTPTLIFGVGFFGFGGVFMIPGAISAYRSYHTGQSILLWTVAMLGLAFAVASLVLVVMRKFFKPSILVFHHDGFFLPRGFLQRKTVWIPCNGVRTVTEIESGAGPILILQTTDGKFEINSILLEQKAIYETVKQLLLITMENRKANTTLN